MADTSALVEQLSGLTVLEVADLVKQLETKWGVSAAAAVAPAATGGGAGAGPAAPVEEKTAFDVILKGIDAAKKIAVIKEGVPKAEAEDIKKKIEAAGGTIEIK